ncbi:MAG: zinc-ribbon domain-containing protein [Armatimonadetes bacterium]|nr:zinc-ribbon domain-containing protein [Armatimonadota bacterium]MBS1710372.1 zinc-ribbon domain-containing protein [Armatimonadota bacterium]MBX3108991.1 zinc-ribbon domain-containing protein [Fimbriimonadaceae bacterium]
MNCPRCGKQNEEEARFCAKCGLNLVEAQRAQSQAAPPGEETRYCYRHPKEATNLSCGRCERPICTKCVILGPAGPRCPDCARSKTEFRPAAVVYGAKKGLGSLVGSAGRGGPFAWYYLIILVMMLGGFIRGCAPMFNQPAGNHPAQSRSADPDR